MIVGHPDKDWYRDNKAPYKQGESSEVTPEPVLF